MVNNCPFGSDLLKNHFDGSQTPTRHTGRPGVHGRVVLVLCKMFVLVYVYCTVASFFTRNKKSTAMFIWSPWSGGRFNYSKSSLSRHRPKLLVYFIWLGRGMRLFFFSSENDTTFYWTPSKRRWGLDIYNMYIYFFLWCFINS